MIDEKEMQLESRLTTGHVGKFAVHVRVYFHRCNVINYSLGATSSRSPFFDNT